MSATSALAALKVLLGTVAPVLTGRAALEATSATLPVITLYSVSDARASLQDYDDLTFTRRVVVEYKRAASAAYDTDLDTALAAIRGALQPDNDGEWLGGNALRLVETTAALFAPPANSGEAVLQINLEFDYRP